LISKKEKNKQSIAGNETLDLRPDLSEDKFILFDQAGLGYFRGYHRRQAAQNRPGGKIL
jgi:hypothetical protein